MTAGEIVDRRRGRACFESEFVEADAGVRRGLRGEEADVAGGGAAVAGDGDVHGDRSAVSEGSLAEIQGSAAWRKGQGIPILGEESHIDAAEAAGLIVAGASVVAEHIETLGVVVGSTQSTARGKAGTAGHLDASDGDVMEGGRMLYCEGIEDEIGLALAAVFLVDESHDGGHLGRGCGSASDVIDFDKAQAGVAILQAEADGIGAAVLTVGREERNVGKMAHAIGRDTFAGLPGGLGIATGCRGCTAGATTAGHDGGLRWVVDAAGGKIQAECTIPGLLGNGHQERNARR